MKIAIANSKNWFTLNNELFKLHDIKIIKKKIDLTEKNLAEFSPDYIFFPHWNWIVSEKIHQKYKCIAFHTAPLPFGKGGSPIQNLILKGFSKTPVCAIKMTNKLDSGPIYGKKNISLEGSLKNILKRINNVVNKFIEEFINHLPQPKQQTSGNEVLFKRLNTSENIIPKDAKLKEIYDRIRMLDEDSYPKAFIKYGDFIIELSNAELFSEEITCKATILNYKKK